MLATILHLAKVDVAVFLVEFYLPVLLRKLVLILQRLIIVTELDAPFTKGTHHSIQKGRYLALGHSEFLCPQFEVFGREPFKDELNTEYGRTVFRARCPASGPVALQLGRLRIIVAS